MTELDGQIVLLICSCVSLLLANLQTISLRYAEYYTEYFKPNSRTLWHDHKAIYLHLLLLSRTSDVSSLSHYHYLGVRMIIIYIVLLERPDIISFVIKITKCNG